MFDLFYDPNDVWFFFQLNTQSTVNAMLPIVKHTSATIHRFPLTTFK